jgi:hypothetical protein
MILIVKRRAWPAGGWGYLGEEAGDEWEPLTSIQFGEGGVAASTARSNAGSRVPTGSASSADTIPILPAITDASAVAPAHVEVPRFLKQGRAT